MSMVWSTVSESLMEPFHLWLWHTSRSLLVACCRACRWMMPAFCRSRIALVVRLEVFCSKFTILMFVGKGIWNLGIYYFDASTSSSVRDSSCAFLAVQKELSFSFSSVCVYSTRFMYIGNGVSRLAVLSADIRKCFLVYRYSKIVFCNKHQVGHGVPSNQHARTIMICSVTQWCHIRPRVAWFLSFGHHVFPKLFHQVRLWDPESSCSLSTVPDTDRNISSKPLFFVLIKLFQWNLSILSANMKGDTATSDGKAKQKMPTVVKRPTKVGFPSFRVFVRYLLS